MKKIVNVSALVIAISLLTAITSFAQDEAPVKYKNPSWVPAEGYWVVISNKQNPKSNEVNFYTNSDELIYTERIEGVKMNAQKTRIKKQLKKAFDLAYKSWAAKEKINDQRLIAQLVE